MIITMTVDIISITSSTPVAMPTACLVVSVVATATVVSALTLTAAAWAVFSRSWFARFWFIVLIICWLCVAAMALTPSAVVLQIQEVLQGLHM